MNDVTSYPSLKAVFRFPARGPDWASRFLVGVLFLFAGFFIPFLPGLFVNGYILRVMRLAVKGEELELPPWDDWGQMLVDGLLVMVIGFVYFLPAIIVMVGGWIFYFGATFSAPIMMADPSAPEEAMGAFVLLMMSMGIMFLSMALGFLLMLLGAIPLPLALAHYVKEDRVGAAFSLRQIWALLRANWLGYFITWVVIFGLIGLLYMGAMLAYMTLILCCLVPLLMPPIGLYLGLIGAALFGQTYRESAELVEATAPAQEVDSVDPLHLPAEEEDLLFLEGETE
jgi:hypothetical protein